MQGHTFITIGCLVLNGTGNNMKKLLFVTSIAALLAGCYTNDPYDDDYRGGTTTPSGVYMDMGTGPSMVNTNSKFTPVNSTAEAALGPGTSSGGVNH